MSADAGIIFDLQWKKKPGGSNREDVASIGIWDTPDSCLDWMTFKSYVCQNLGTAEDIYVAYVDSDGDEIPIESECEFQEALKFARQRATKGREVVLKVEKRGCTSFIPSSEPKQKRSTASKLSNDSDKDLKKKPLKFGKITKTKSGDKHQNSTSLFTNRVFSEMEEKKSKNVEHNIPNELGKKIACIMKLEPDKRKKVKSDKDDSPPTWFKNYMQKFKNEIVAEVTTNIMHNTKLILENNRVSTHSTCSSCEKNSASVMKIKKKKKTTDDDSSDCAQNSDQRDHKLLKKIEKLHKREKKLEKKLDSKLEKLENKTKRRMEKKFQTKSCSEQPLEKKVCAGSRKRLSHMPVPVGTYLMDAIPLNDGLKPPDQHIKLGERFTRVWYIMNNGTLPWTDKFPGVFESYWHFYHMGDRFGHWLCCAVIVDSVKPDKEPNEFVHVLCNSDSTDYVVDDKEESKPKTDQAIDLRIKCETEEVNKAAPSQANEEENVCARVHEDKYLESLAIESRSYESESDDENLSVISGTISLTSDSEEDGNFVVVPMPACFVCDVPLENSEMIPLTSNEKEKGDFVECDSSSDVKEMSSTEPDDICIVSTSQCSTQNDQHHESIKENETEITPECNETSINNETNLYDESFSVLTTNSIYAVDMEGHCMLVNNTSEGQSSKEDENSDSSVPKNNSEYLSGQDTTDGVNGEHTQKPPFHVSYSHCQSQAYTPFHSVFQVDSVGNGQNTDATFNRNSKSSSGAAFQHNVTQATSAHTSPNSPQESRGASVHILPETLVTGAINVASQAFTTARAVLNNLRSNRPSEEFEWHWDENAATWSQQTEKSTSECLNILIDMGFTNRILNVLLLQRYDNDITKVVAELLTYQNNQGFTYNR
ncbi:hypothetical protein C0J52_20100 [Blattella germanica]|nr:hypothetical protein C0J52_20100 [Blattella germanica]